MKEFQVSCSLGKCAKFDTLSSAYRWAEGGGELARSRNIEKGKKIEGKIRKFSHRIEKKIKREQARKFNKK